MSNRFFPELELESTTPAFKKNKGFTTYVEMMHFLELLQGRYPQQLKIDYIGKSQKGKRIPLVRLSNTNNTEKIRVWIQAAIHGDEPASTEGVLYLVQQILENASYRHLLDRLDLAIVPMGNIDGFELQERMTSNGLDMNRDQTKLLIPETVLLKKAFSNFGAQVALDFHEYNPFRSDYLKMGRAGYTLPHDVMFLYSGNLNIAASLRDYTQTQFVNRAKADFQQKGFKTFDYFLPSTTSGFTQYNIGSANARASATSFALTNCVSTLFEVRGVSLGRTAFKRRTLITFYLGLSYLESAYRDGDNLRKVLAGSVYENQKAVISSRRKGAFQDFEFIDMDSNSLIKKRVFTRNALHAEPVKTRSIPTAYILTPKQLSIVAKLKILGIAVDTVGTPFSSELECYNVKKYRRETVKYEGTYRQFVKTSIKKQKKIIEKGSFVVWTDQKNRGLLLEVLEPECDNSFVSFGIIATNKGEELPFYRLMADPSIKENLFQLKDL